MFDAMWERRRFLLRAGQGVAGLSLLGGWPLALPAEKNSKRPAGDAAERRAPQVRVNVRDMGARGDGASKDTAALQQALDRAAVLGGGEVLVPAGEYLTGPLILRSNTTLRVEEGASLLGSPDIADYRLTQVRWEGRWIKGYGALISAEDARDIAILGRGKIVASKAIKGRVVHADGSPVVYARAAAHRGGPEEATRQEVLRNPALLEFTQCRDVLVEGVYTEGNDMWSTHPVYSQNVTFRNVTVHSGADGIDVDSCKGVLIDGCDFETRDDCISLKSGRGMEGYTIGVPCEDVKIANCTFKDAVWACIGIGSETSAGIRNVRVEHCKCLGARTFAIYIKSRPGRGAFLEDISMDDLEVSGAGQGFLRINVLSSGLQDAAPVPGDPGIPTTRNFAFTNIHVHDVPVLVEADEIHPAKPLQGLVLRGISGTCGKGIRLANVRDAVLSDIHVSGFEGPLLSAYGTTGKGLAGAAALDAPKLPEPIAAPAEPYVLK